MKTNLALFASLVGYAFVPSFALSGKILDAYGAGKAGVVVTVGSSTATTDANGAWTIGSTTGIAKHSVQGQALNGGHVSFVNGRMVLSFNGYDFNGRPLSKGSAIANTGSMASGISARAVGATPDTFTYSWHGTVFLRDTTSDLTRGGIVANFDTTINAKIIYGWLTDSRDGQLYRTVSIGSQVWMAQNLNFKIDSSWWYDSSADSGAKYGRLYTWAEAMGVASIYNWRDTSLSSPQQQQGICTSGWHVPSDSEWSALQLYVAPTDTTDATKLKSTSGCTYSGNGTDVYGFHALPGGYFNGSTFINVGYYGNWWSATENDATYAWYRSMNCYSAHVDTYSHYKKDGFSLRCLKNN